MKKLVAGVLFSASFLIMPHIFALGSDQSTSDSGVLVSSSIPAQASGQDTLNNNENDDTSDLTGKEVPNRSGQRHLPVDSGDTSNGAVDEIVAKSTKAVMSQISDNMKLTQSQLNDIRPIIEDYIVKARDLQLSLEKGDIDGKAMYIQREQLTNDENQKLSHIMSPDQMKVWMNIQN